MSRASTRPAAARTDRAARLRETRRAAILAAAKAVFAEKGYHDASVNDVIERAGIARGTFYLYFEGKAQVFESVLAEALLALRAVVRPIDVSRGAPPPARQLREMLTAALGYARADREFTRLLLSSCLHPDPEVARLVDGFYRHVTDLLAASLAKGVRLGLVRPCDPALIAPLALGAVRGAVGHLLLSGRPPPLERIVDALISFAMTGVGASGRWGAPR